MQLQNEVESFCVRGVRAISAEQLNWMKNARSKLEESGAQHLSEKIAALLTAIDQNDTQSAARLLDLLVNVRVFERVLTLKLAGEKLSALQSVQAGEAN